RDWNTAGCGPDCGPTGFRQSLFDVAPGIGGTAKLEPGPPDIARSGNFCGAGPGGAVFASGRRAGSGRAGFADGAAGGVAVAAPRGAVAEASARYGADVPNGLELFPSGVGAGVDGVGDALGGGLRTSVRPSSSPLSTSGRLLPKMATSGTL